MSQEAPQNTSETEIEPLSDEALENVAGGAEFESAATELCSYVWCSNKP